MSQNHLKVLCSFKSHWQYIESGWNLVPMQCWHPWRCCQTAMGDKPFRMRWYILLGIIICWVQGLWQGELIVMVSELELHKHSIWPSLIYAQRQILVWCWVSSIVWGGDSIEPETHEVRPFTLTPWSVPQGVILILDLAIGCKHCWKAEKVSGVLVGVCKGNPC